MIRVLILFLAFVSLAHAEGDSAEARINRTAFPIAKYSSKYAPVSKSVETEIRGRMQQVLGPIRLAPKSWFRTALGITPSVGDQKRILDSVLDTEIWKCLGDNCSGCSGGSLLGCVRNASALGGVGTVVNIHPCLVGEAPCPSGVKVDTAKWTEETVTAIAFYKSGLANKGDALKVAQKASSAWISRTSMAVNQIMGSCPGPYSADSLKFLLSIDAISDPNPAIRKCGEKYLSALQDLPSKCTKIRTLMNDEWNGFSKEYLSGSPEIFRCDPYCRKLLCRTASVKTIFTSFSGKARLLLADGACEGESANDVPNFLRDALPRALRPRIESYGCIPKGKAPSEEKDSVEGLSNGTGVDLVE